MSDVHKHQSTNNRTADEQLNEQRIRTHTKQAILQELNAQLQIKAQKIRMHLHSEIGTIDENDHPANLTAAEGKLDSTFVLGQSRHPDLELKIQGNSYRVAAPPASYNDKQHVNAVGRRTVQPHTKVIREPIMKRMGNLSSGPE